MTGDLILVAVTLFACVWILAKRRVEIEKMRLTSHELVYAREWSEAMERIQADHDDVSRRVGRLETTESARSLGRR